MYSIKELFTKILQWIKSPKRTESTGTDAFFRAENSDTGVACSFGVVSSGTNHGLWSHKLGKWLIYGDASIVRVNGGSSGDTVLGGDKIVANVPIYVGSYKFLTIEIKSADNISVTANSYKEGSISIAKTGYTPIGILDYYASNASSSGTGSSFAMIYQNYIDRSTKTYHYGIRNTNSSAIKVKINARILYVSTTQGV